MSKRTCRFRDLVTSAVMSSYNKQIRQGAKDRDVRLPGGKDLKALANELLPGGVSARKRESLTRQFA